VEKKKKKIGQGGWDFRPSRKRPQRAHPQLVHWWVLIHSSRLSSTRGLSQSWLEVGQDGTKCWESCLLLATYKNSLSKSGEFLFLFFFPQNLATYVYIFQKTLSRICTAFFLVASAKIHQNNNTT
jgi:hypothetical protein